MKSKLDYNIIFAKNINLNTEECGHSHKWNYMAMEILTRPRPASDNGVFSRIPTMCQTFIIVHTTFIPIAVVIFSSGSSIVLTKKTLFMKHP